MPDEKPWELMMEEREKAIEEMKCEGNSFDPAYKSLEYAQKAIVFLLQAEGPLNVVDIGEHLGLTMVSVRPRLTSLVNQERIIVTDDGKFDAK